MPFLRSLYLGTSSATRKIINLRPTPFVSPPPYALSAYIASAPPILFNRHFRSSSNMSSASFPMGKSDEEWRAVLSPTQVRLFLPPIFVCSLTFNTPISSRSFARKAQRPLSKENMISTTPQKVSTPAQHVVHPSILPPQSSRAAVGGLRSTMVRIVLSSARHMCPS